MKLSDSLNEVVMKNVGYTYKTPAGPIAALVDFSLCLPKATSTAVVGRSGSGKSTLVTLLATMRRPTSGQIFYSGVDERTMSDNQLSSLRSRSIGLVFQTFHLDLGSSAIDNVLIPWFFCPDISKKQAGIQANLALELMGIRELRDRKVGQMSGGQRQRVAIARALIFNPGLLIADEPTGNLDEETGKEVADHLLGLPSALGTSVVLVTHDEQIAAGANRVVRIAGGRLDSIQS